MVRVALPRTSAAGQFRLQLAWAEPTADYPWAPVAFNVTVQPNAPVVVSVEPSQWSSQGGDRVLVCVTGLPPSLSPANLSVAVGQGEVSPTRVVWDDEGVCLALVAPSAPPGLGSLTVWYAWEPDAAAAVHVLVLTDQSAAVCLSGCRRPVESEGGEQEAVVEVRASAAAPAALPSATTLVVNCSLQLPGRVLHADQTNYCTLEAVTVERTCTTAAGATPAAAAAACYTVRISYAPTAALAEALGSAASCTGFLLLTSRSNASGGALAVPLAFVRPPRLVSARFSPSLASVLVTFDQATWSDDKACDAMVDTARLGLRPVCTWQHPSFYLVLGIGASLLSTSCWASAPRCSPSRPT